MAGYWQADRLANAIRSRPTVDQAVQDTFGMQPGMDRLNLLPRYSKADGWVAPEMVYQLARAMVSPGVAAQGGDVSPQDAMNFAGNVSLGGIGASAAMRNPAPGPGRTVAINAYHGTYGDLDLADVSRRGELTGARSAREATWFVDDPKTAGAYAVYAAEDGPVKRALAEAAKLERKAQRTGAQADWAAYDAKMLEAEALDAYAARTDRRAGANVFEVDIPDEIDLLTVEAQGKTPWELTQEADVDSFLTERLREARKQGKAGVRFNSLDDAVNLSNRPATHFALFDPSVVKVLGKKK